MQQLEKEIEQNKKQANLFISGIVKTAVHVENELAEEAPITEKLSVEMTEESPKPKKTIKKPKLKLKQAEE